MDRRLNARIQHKIDTQENWEKAVNFIPLKGEWIFYDKDAENADIRLKIGDGETNVNELPFVSTGGAGDDAGPITVYDVEGLLTQEKHTILAPFWEYSEDMIPYMEMPQSDGTWSVYSISDNTSSELWIGSTITTIDGEIIEITSDNIVMTLNGLYNIKHPVDSRDYLLVFTSDFDPSAIGLETFDIGTYAVRSSSGWGVASVSTLTEATESVISKELLPKPLRIGETGLKIEWDGTPTDVCFDLTDTFGVKFYKMSEPVSTIYNGRYTYNDINDPDTGYIIDNDYYIKIEGAEYSTLFDLWNVFTSVPLTVDTTPVGGPGILQMSFPEPGLYFVWNNENSFVRGFVTEDYGTATFEDKYIPDTIARKSDLENIDLSKKADLVNGKIPLSQIPDGIGSQADWNESDSTNSAFIKNKPFGEEGLKILWDGIDRGELCIDVSDTLGLKYYKMLEPLSQSEILASKISVIRDGVINTLTVNYSNIVTINDDCYIIMDGSDPYLFVSLRPTTADFSSLVGSTLVLNIEHAGTWFLYGNENLYTCELIGSDYNLKKIDDKFVPQSDWNETDINSGTYIKNKTHYYYSKFKDIEWDSLTTGLVQGNMSDPSTGEALPYEFYKVADLIPDIQAEDFLGAILESYSNGSLTISDPFGESDIAYNSNLILLGGFGAFVAKYDNITVNLESLVGLNGNEMSGISAVVTAPEAGIYFMKINYSQGGYSINGYASKLNAPKQYVPLDEEYIPDTIMRVPEYGVAELNSNGKINIDNLPTTDTVEYYTDFIPTESAVMSALKTKVDLVNNLVPIESLPMIDTVNEGDTTHIPTADAIIDAISGLQRKSEKNAAYGYAGLNYAKKVKIENLPAVSVINESSFEDTDTTSIPTTQAVYNALQNKVNTSDIYTKTEVDNKLSSKASLEENGTIPISQLPIDEIIAAVIAAIPNGDEVSY